MNLATFIFRSSEVRQLTLDLYLFGNTGLMGMFLSFPLNRTADNVALQSGVEFQQLLCLGSLKLIVNKPISHMIPKGLSSSSVADYR